MLVCVAAVPARCAMHKQAHARSPRAMVPDVRNQPAIATRFCRSSARLLRNL